MLAYIKIILEFMGLINKAAKAVETELEKQKIEGALDHAEKTKDTGAIESIINS